MQIVSWTSRIEIINSVSLTSKIIIICITKNYNNFRTFQNISLLINWLEDNRK